MAAKLTQPGATIPVNARRTCAFEVFDRSGRFGKTLWRCVPSSPPRGLGCFGPPALCRGMRIGLEFRQGEECSQRANTVVCADGPQKESGE